MSEDVISLTSSDDENPEPPPKRKKLAPAPDVTLTLVPNSKKKNDQIETVNLDSDDDLDKSNPSRAKLISENPEKVDLITLTDDEEDISHAHEVNNVNSIINSIFNSDKVEIVTTTKDAIVQDKSETVSIIDSDSETEQSANIQPTEETCNKSTNENTIVEPNENANSEIVEVTNKKDADEAKDSNLIECQEKNNTVSITDSDSETELNTKEKEANIVKSTLKEVTATDDEIIEITINPDKEANQLIPDSDVIEIVNEPDKEIKNGAHHNQDITVSITDSDNETDLITEKKAVEETCKETTDANENVFVQPNILEPNKDSTEKVEETKEAPIEENALENAMEIDAIKELDKKVTKEVEIPIEASKSDEEIACIEDDLLNVSRIEVDEKETVINGSKIEKEVNSENELTINTDTSSNDVPGPSTSLNDEPVIIKNKTFKMFLKIVEEKIVDSTFEEILPKKVPIIQKYFKKCGIYVNENNFEKLLNDCIETVKNAPNSNAANTAVLSFHKIFEHLKSHVTETSIEIEQEHLPKVKKLEKTMKLLIKRIKILEEAEVNFDDEEDSAYMILDRYETRLSKVYAKYCEYIRRNPFSGRAVYDKISFVHSKHNSINQAISKKYRNSVTFPSYYELEKYIGKISKREKLDLSDSEIKREAKKCFKYLGNILQKKRRQELYDSHLGFIESTDDPATKDISLENLLKKNYSEGKEKIDKLYQKYADKQEQGEDHISSDGGETSEDSDSQDLSKKESNKKDKNKKENGCITENVGEKENKPNEEQEVINSIEDGETVKKKVPQIIAEKDSAISDKETDKNLQNSNIKET